MKAKPSARPGLTGYIASLALLSALALFGCNRQEATAPDVSTTTPEALVPPPTAQPAAVDDDFVYYPQYEVYFSPHRHQYYYREGDTWGWRPKPSHVSVNALLGSPSVHMDFHDAPERHHEEIRRRYPKDWHSSDDRRDEHKP